MSANRIYIYKRYERFWHWSQALLIIIMIATSSPGRMLAGAPGELSITK